MERLPAVDALRAFFIFIVMGHHFFSPKIQSLGSVDVGLNFMGPLFLNGFLGVTGFFVVSGFLITRLILQDGFHPVLSLREFYVRRIARILPLLSLVVILGLLVLVFHPQPTSLTRNLFFGPPGVFTTGFWISIALFFFNWHFFLVIAPSGLTTGLYWIVLWSLAVEEQFYLFYPMLLRKLVSEKGIYFALGLITFSGLVFRAWAFGMHPYAIWWNYPTPSAFDPLALGALSYLLWKKVRDDLRKQPAVTFFLALVGGFIILRVIWTVTQRPLNQIFGPFLLSLGCSLFLIGACSLPKRTDTWLRPLAWIGSLSYGLYLYHVSVYYFLVPILSHLPNYDLGAVLFFLTTLVVAALSHRFFETPANHWIRRIGKRFIGKEPG